MTERIRILIADDSPLFRKGLHALLRSFADAELVGEAIARIHRDESVSALFKEENDK